MTLAKNEQPFLALQPDGMEILQANLPALTMNPWDMDRAKVPAGGGSTWEIPDLDEGTKAVKSLEGIILYFASPRRISGRYSFSRKVSSRLRTFTGSPAPGSRRSPAR